MGNVVLIVMIALFVALLAVGGLFLFTSFRHFDSPKKDTYRSLFSVQGSYDRIRKKNRIPCSVLYIHPVIDQKYMKDREQTLKSILDLAIKIFDGEDNIIASYQNRGFVLLTQSSENVIVEKFQQLSGAVNMGKDGLLGTRVYLGAYLIPANDVSFEDAVSRALLASHEAVRQGKLYLAWDYNMQKNHDLEMELSDHFKKGFEENNFFLEFQAIIDLKSGNVVGGEVLTRLSTEAFRIVNPNAFIPVINQNDMDSDFDFFVFEKFCKWANVNKEILDSLQFVSVNFSRITIARDDFVEKVFSTINEYHLNPKHIAIEILEDANGAYFDAEKLKANLSAIREKGVVVLYDDFGTGYTCLEDLQNLEIDFIKIDRNMIKNTNSEIGSKIFNNILSMARDLGLSIIVEGVEEASQIEFLNRNNCRYVQGFYFYHPMRADQFEKLIENSGQNA